MVQVTFSVDAAHEVAEVSQAPAASQPEPGSLQPRHVKQETRKVAVQTTLHDAVSAPAAAGCTICYEHSGSRTGPKLMFWRRRE